MIRRQKLEAARATMAKIYSSATSEQVDLKVCTVVIDPRAYIDRLMDDKCTRSNPWLRQ